MFSRIHWTQERLGRQRDRKDTSHECEKGCGPFEIARSSTTRRRQHSSFQASREPGEEWMSRLEDDTFVSALTLPGTHDSAAYTYAWPFVQTQTMDLLQQLNLGIRYFDLRCGIRDDVVEMVHGPSILGITLDVVLETLCVWLSHHETEALVVQIKQDRKAERSAVHFAQAIWKCLARRPERCRTANTTPRLGELRGKIQLLRRFDGPTLYAYGIDVTQWQDNPVKPFTILTRNEVKITIQDHYNFSEPESLPSLITVKGGDVSELLNRAAIDPDQKHWYINFTSAFEFNLYYQLPPREIAIGGWWGFRWEDGINVRLRNYLKAREGPQRFGIVAMDFPDRGADDLVEALISSNFKQKSRSMFNLASHVVLLLVLAVLLVLIASRPVRTTLG